MVHTQLLTGKDCLENGALDTAQRAHREPHQKWVPLPLQENIQLPHMNNILKNESTIVTRLWNSNRWDTLETKWVVL